MGKPNSVKKTLKFFKGLLKRSCTMNIADLEEGQRAAHLHGFEEVHVDREMDGKDKGKSPKENHIKIGLDFILCWDKFEIT
jgi:hypothetical protein